MIPLCKVYEIHNIFIETQLKYFLKISQYCQYIIEFYVDLTEWLNSSIMFWYLPLDWETGVTVIIAMFVLVCEYFVWVNDTEEGKHFPIKQSFRHVWPWPDTCMQESVRVFMHTHAWMCNVDDDLICEECLL